MESNQSNNQNLDHQQDLSILWKAFSFLFPIVGIIIYFFQKNKGEILKAKSGITAAVAGMILNVLILLTRSVL